MQDMLGFLRAYLGWSLKPMVQNYQTASFYRNIVFENI